MQGTGLSCSRSSWLFEVAQIHLSLTPQIEYKNSFIQTYQQRFKKINYQHSNKVRLLSIWLFFNIWVVLIFSGATSWIFCWGERTSAFRFGGGALRSQMGSWLDSVVFVNRFLSVVVLVIKSADFSPIKFALVSIRTLRSNIDSRIDPSCILRNVEPDSIQLLRFVHNFKSRVVWSNSQKFITHSSVFVVDILSLLVHDMLVKSF